MNGFKKTFEFFNLLLGMVFMGSSALLFKAGMDEQSPALQAVSVALLLATLLLMLRARWHRLYCRDCGQLPAMTRIRFRAADTEAFLLAVTTLSAAPLDGWSPSTAENDRFLEIQLCPGCSTNAHFAIYRKGFFRNRLVHSRAVTENQELPAFVAALTALEKEKPLIRPEVQDVEQPPAVPEINCGEKQPPQPEIRKDKEQPLPPPKFEYGEIIRSRNIFTTAKYVGVYFLIALALAFQPYDSFEDFLLAGFVLGVFAFFVRLGDWDYYYCSKCRNEAGESRAIHFPIRYRDSVHAAIRNDDYTTLENLPLIQSSESVVTLHLLHCWNCYNTARVTVHDVDKDFVGVAQDADLINRKVTGQMAAILISLVRKAEDLQGMSGDDPEFAADNPEFAADNPEFAADDPPFDGLSQPHSQRQKAEPGTVETGMDYIKIAVCFFLHVLLFVLLDEIIPGPVKPYIIPAIMCISLFLFIKTANWRMTYCSGCKNGYISTFSTLYPAGHKITISNAIRNNDRKTLKRLPRAWTAEPKVLFKVTYCRNCRDYVIVTIDDIIQQGGDAVRPPGEEPVNNMYITGKMARTLIRLGERHSAEYSPFQE